LHPRRTDLAEALRIQVYFEGSGSSPGLLPWFDEQFSQDAEQVNDAIPLFVSISILA